MVMGRRRQEWFGLIKNRKYPISYRNEDGGKHPRGRPKLRWKDTVWRFLKAWNIRDEWPSDRKRWKGICKVKGDQVNSIGAATTVSGTSVYYAVLLCK